jgi:PAS domain S-box-containing protein
VAFRKSQESSDLFVGDYFASSAPIPRIREDKPSMHTVVADQRASEHPASETSVNHLSDENAFRALLERSGLCVAKLDLNIRVIEADHDFMTSFGLSRDALTGCSFYDLLHPGVRGPIRRQFERLLDGRRHRFVERLVGVGPQQAAFNGEITGVAVRGTSGELAYLAVVVNPEKPGPANSVVVNRTRILTDLDARILEGIASGESTVRMASRLFLSRQGVEYHVGTMLRKLKVTNRAALVSRAYSLGVLSVGAWPPRVLPEFVK